MTTEIWLNPHPGIAVSSAWLADEICGFIESRDPEFKGLSVMIPEDTMSILYYGLQHAVYCHNLGMPFPVLRRWMATALKNPNVHQNTVDYYSEKVLVSPFYICNEPRAIRYLRRGSSTNPSYPIFNLKKRLEGHNLMNRSEPHFDFATLRMERELYEIIVHIRNHEEESWCPVIQLYTEMYFGVALEYVDMIAPDLLLEQYWNVILDPEFCFADVKDGILEERKMFSHLHFKEWKRHDEIRRYMVRHEK